MPKPKPTSVAGRSGQAALAKLTRPRSDGLIVRQRLIDLLGSHRQIPMVWVAAPPGAGKTSLLATYLDSRAQPVVWVQVDSGDTDPATFFHYLTRATSAITEQVPPLPVFAPQDSANPAAFARRYFREWFAIPAEGTTLVLDNLQEAGDASTWHHILATLVEETPPGVQTIAISRTGLPAELSRARLARQVQLVEWRDLRLSRDEAAQLALQLGLAAPTDINHLWEQSQGWAAGLVLLLERYKQSGTLQPDAFAGSLEAVFDYFAGQMFNASPPVMQETLMRLSFLPRMTAESAVAVSRNQSAVAMLDELARKNLFIDRRWSLSLGYQFHALFREFLQARARQRLGEAECRACANLAAQVLQESGHHDDAIRLFIDVADWSSAVRLILEQAESLIQTGRHQILAEWIRSIPQIIANLHHWLGYWHGVAIVGQDAASSREMIKAALAAFDRDEDLRGQVRALASLMSGWWAERASLHWLEPYVDRLNALLADDGRFDLRTRALGLISVARARIMIQPNDPLLADYARRLAALPIEDLTPELAVGVGTCLIGYYWGIGDSEACTVVARRTRPAALSSEVPVSDRLWFWFWLLTHVVYLSDVEQGREIMQRARELNDESRLSPPFADFIRWNVTLELQLGRPDRARQMLEEELLPILNDASLQTQACVDLEQARIGIEEGRITEAITHAQRGFDLCAEGGLGWMRASLGLTLICAQALAGLCDAAHANLHVLRQSIGQNLPILSGSIETYQALVHLQSGQLNLARTALARAVELRRLTHYPWGPGWNRPGIALVAAFALNEGRHVLEMQKIVEGLRITPPSPDIEHWPWPVRIKVLDGFSIQLIGQVARNSVGKASHRILMLLKALAAMGGDAVSAELLADLIWPEADGDNARRSLDTSLSRLRKMLNCDQALTIRDGKLSLNPDWVSLDLRSFKFQLSRLDTLKAGSGEWQASAQRAIDLYRRHLLADETDHDWLLPRREVLRKQWLAVAENLASAYKAEGASAKTQRLSAQIERVENI